MQSDQIYPQPSQNEPDVFFRTQTIAIIASTNNIQKLLRFAANLTIEHSRPPLLPTLITNHHNNLSTIFAQSHTHLLHILSTLSSISGDLNIRSGFLNAYTYACKQTQKTIDALKQIRQKTVIDNRKVDLALADLQFQKNVENGAKEALDQCSDDLRRKMVGWREEYTKMVGDFVESGVGKQVACHQDMILQIEAALELI